MKKKLIAFLLALTMVICSFPVSAFAWTKGSRFSEDLVQAMKEICEGSGLDPEEILNTLYRNGMIDAEGNPIVNDTFLVDEGSGNVSKTLEELRAMSVGKSTDAAVSVNNVDTTWGTVQKLFAFIDVMSILTSQETLTQAHIDNMKSFYSALLDGDIDFTNVSSSSGSSDVGRIYLKKEGKYNDNDKWRFCSVTNGALADNTNYAMSGVQALLIRLFEKEYLFSSYGQTDGTFLDNPATITERYLFSQQESFFKDELCQKAGVNYWCIDLCIHGYDDQFNSTAASIYPSAYSDSVADANNRETLIGFNEALCDSYRVNSVYYNGYEVSNGGTLIKFKKPLSDSEKRLIVLDSMFPDAHDDSTARLKSIYVKIYGCDERIPVYVHYSYGTYQYTTFSGESVTTTQVPEYLYINLPPYLGKGFEYCSVHFYYCNDPTSDYDYITDSEDRLASGDLCENAWVADSPQWTLVRFLRASAALLDEKAVDIVYNETWEQYAKEDDAAGTISFDPEIKGLDLVSYNTALEEAALTTPLAITYELTNDKNYTNVDASYFSWESSDPEVATISAVLEDYEWTSDAAIKRVVATVIPLSAGDVTFKLTVKGGEEDVVLESAKLSIIEGEDPYLLIPATSQNLTAVLGNDASILFATNIHRRNSQQYGRDTKYDFRLYKSGDLGTPVYTAAAVATIDNPVLSWTVPAAELEVGTYVAKIKTDCYESPAAFEAQIGPKVFEAEANLEVKAGPIGISIDANARNYCISGEGYTVNWNWSGVNEASNTKQWKYEVISQDSGEVVTSAAFNDFSISSLTLTPADIPHNNKLKESYVISIYASNDPDNIPWSCESMLLLSYNTDAVDIVVKSFTVKGEDAIIVGDDDNVYNLDLHDFLEGANGHTRKISADGKSLDLVANHYSIAQLQKELKGGSVVHIKYGNYVWGLFDDMLQWDVESADKNADLYYNAGDEYFSFDQMGSNRYLPVDELWVTGEKDGTSTILVKHENTGITTSVAINIDRLDNQLYLFQFYPLVETTVKYVDGLGNDVIVTSDALGQLALYEPNGFKEGSGVYYSSKYGGSEYLGMSYAEDLRSGEPNTGAGKTYPVNSYRLVKCEAYIYFIKPDGKPLANANVTVRGGVYYNGEYCTNADLFTNAAITGLSEDGRSTGLDAQTFTTDKNGRIKVYYNSGQFFEAGSGHVLSAEDDIKFAFEIQFAGDAYCPEIFEMDTIAESNTSRNLSKNCYLKATNAKTKGQTYIYDEHYEVFKAGRSIGTVLLDGTDSYLGPNSVYTQSALYPMIALWENKDLIEKDETTSQSSIKNGSTISVEYVTSKNKDITNQTGCEPVVYEFSTIPFVKLNFTMNAETFNGWLTANQFDAASIAIKDDGEIVKTVPLSYQIINDIATADPIKSDGGAKDAAEDASEDLKEKLNFESLLKDLVPGGDILYKGITMVSALTTSKAGSQKGFYLTMLPTPDPTIFNIVVSVGGEEYIPEDVNYNSEDSADYIDNMTKGLAMMKDTGDRMEDDSSPAAGGYGAEFSFNGAMIARAKYDPKTAKWSVSFVGGDFHAAAAVEMFYELSLGVGGAAVQVSFSAGVGLDATISSRYKDNQHALLTDIILDVGMEAFCGFGIDAIIASLSIGIFGDVNFAIDNKIFSGSNTRTMYGTQFRGTGSVGVKLVAEILFVSYEKVFASVSFEKQWSEGDYNAINTKWEGITTLGNPYSASLSKGNLILNVSKTSKKLFALPKLGTPAPENLITSSKLTGDENVRLSEDGKVALYTDEAGELSWAVKSGSAYNKQGSIASAAALSIDDFGDYYSDISGNNGKYVAVWTKQLEEGHREKGDRTPISNEELSMAMNSTEIYASVYDSGTNTWTTPVRLTTNSEADVSPKVSMASDGTAVMAWRQAKSSSAEKPLDFNAGDVIYAATMSALGSWSEPVAVYNASAGAPKALSVSAGKNYAVVSYTVETNVVHEAASGSGLTPSSEETYYSIIKNEDSSVQTVRATVNDYVDENVQSARCIINGNECVVLSWFVSNGDEKDIELLCIDTETGLIKSDFPQSLSKLAGYKIPSNYKIVEASSTDLAGLSVAWVEHDSEKDSYDIWGAKFYENGSTIGVTPKQKIGSTNEKVAVDDFCAYADGNEITLILTESDYTSGEVSSDSIAVNDIVNAVILRENYETQEEYEAEVNRLKSSETIKILTAKAAPKLELKTYTFANGLDAQAKLGSDNVIPGLTVALDFTFTNTGAGVLRDIELNKVNGADAGEVASIAAIEPGQSKTLTVFYKLPAVAADLDYQYKVSASGLSAELEGTIVLNAPKIDVAGVKTIKAEGGKRLLSVQLANPGFIDLKDNNKKVVLSIAEDPDLSKVVTSVAITGNDDLEEIDEGGYFADLDIDVRKFAKNGKLNEAGIPLYAIASVSDNPGTNTLAKKTAMFTLNPIGNGDWKITTNTKTDDGSYIVDLDIVNTALVEKTIASIDVIVYDEDGNEITRQETNSAGNESAFIKLGAEASTQASITFASQSDLGGKTASYAEVVILKGQYDVKFSWGSLATEDDEYYLEKTVTYGALVASPTDPVKGGDIFRGWFDDENCMTPHDFSKPVKEDMTIYSCWKRTAEVSGVTMSAVYTYGDAISYSGTPAATCNLTPVAVSGFAFEFAGTTGTAFTRSTTTPTAVGNYKMIVSIDDADYFGEQNLFFTITAKAITVTAIDKNIRKGESAPAFGDTDYRVDGLVGADTLLTKPALCYDPSSPDTSVMTLVAIKASGADAGPNYTINYVDGWLSISSLRIEDEYYIFHDNELSHIMGADKAELLFARRDMGNYDLQAVSRNAIGESIGWTIKVSDMTSEPEANLNSHTGKYLAEKNGRLVYTNEPFVWSYDDGAFYVEKTIESTSLGYTLFGRFIQPASVTKHKVYYLSTTAENASLSQIYTLSQLRIHIAEHNHAWTPWINLYDGTHARYCPECTQVEKAACIYDRETGRCECGAYDHSRVEVQRNIHSYAIKDLLGTEHKTYITKFTADSSMISGNLKVAVLAYSTDNGRHWILGDTAITDHEIANVLVRVADNEGNTYVVNGYRPN